MEADDNTPAEPFIALSFKGDDLRPDELISLFKLRARLPRRKGDPRSPGRPSAGVAPTGYCSFSTLAVPGLATASDHLRFLLDELAPVLPALRQLIGARSLRWTATFFDGDGEGGRFADLDPALLRRAAGYGLALEPAEPQAVTFIVVDPPASEL